MAQRRYLLWLVAATLAHTAVDAAASVTSARQTTTPASAQGDPGIPITSALVREECTGACHRLDDQQRISRISYRRTTPEGWERTVQRMASLNFVRLEPAAAREIVRYLSNNLGLAPEEARPGAFEVERRLIEYSYTADPETEKTCINCHSMGRVITQRRTKEEWELLMATHRGLYPLADTQGFRHRTPVRPGTGPDGRPIDTRQPMDKAIEHLSRAFPLTAPEWSAWSATVRPAQLDGRWALSGHHPGLGPVYGELVVQAHPGTNDEFTTEARYVYARGGATVARTGRAIVYTGFQWRGRSVESESGLEDPPDVKELREVLFVERDWQQMSGRWYTGGYDELGLDMTARRIGSDAALVLGVEPSALQRGAVGQSVRVFGLHLGGTPALDFGPGVRVQRVASRDAWSVTVTVDVASDALVGSRDVTVGQTPSMAAVVVYDRVDTLKVSPQAGMARVGGIRFPKQHQAFEAVAYSYGPDGLPDTADDLQLGLADVTWTLEEFPAVLDDDDVHFVGEIHPTSGLFTPAVDGPNPERRSNMNNIGDVWVVATLGPSAATGDRVLRARAHLLVTVPLYVRWDPWRFIE